MKLVVAILILILIYYLQKKLYKKYWDKGLDMNISFNRDFIECGESAELVEVVTNDKTLPLPIFNLKFSIDKNMEPENRDNLVITDLYHKNEVFSIMGHQRITRRLKFKAVKRGVISIRNANILVHDLFMMNNYAKRIPHDDAIYIFPLKLYTKRIANIFKGILGEIEIRRSMVEDSLAFRGIREYQPFDSYRSINWKQTARTGNLMVNMRGFTTDSRVRIMLNLDYDLMIETDKLYETAISLASTLTRLFIDKSVNVSMVTNGKGADGQKLPPVEEGVEKKHAITIDRLLTEIKDSSGKDEFLDILDLEIQNIRKDTVYIIISPYAKKDLLSRLDMIEKKGGVVKLIVPYFDEFGFSIERSYAEGWEVPYNV